MAHWEKDSKNNSHFLIFHKIAVLWCCKAQSHLSFYLKTNVKLWCISAKWKWQSLAWYRTTKKCIKLQQLNKAQLHYKGPKPVAKTAETGNFCSRLGLLPPLHPDSATQDPRQGLTVASLLPILPVGTSEHILSSRRPWQTSSSKTWQASRQTLRSCRVQHTVYTGISERVVYFGFGRATECQHVSASKKIST